MQILWAFRFNSWRGGNSSAYNKAAYCVIRHTFFAGQKTYAAARSSAAARAAWKPGHGIAGGNFRAYNK
ncbi:MAG: hypothetical protein LBK44_03350, partial [Spirochaetales bacterium]|nr:hypothetical protein [Spirochaetales bacterium]